MGWASWQMWVTLEYQHCTSANAGPQFPFYKFPHGSTVATGCPGCKKQTPSSRRLYLCTWRGSWVLWLPYSIQLVTCDRDLVRGILEGDSENLLSFSFLLCPSVPSLFSLFCFIFPPWDKVWVVCSFFLPCDPTMICFLVISPRQATRLVVKNGQRRLTLHSFWFREPLD